MNAEHINLLGIPMYLVLCLLPKRYKEIAQSYFPWLSKKVSNESDLNQLSLVLNGANTFSSVRVEGECFLNKKR